MLAATVHVPLAALAEGLEHRPVQLEVLHQLHAAGDFGRDFDAGAAQLGVAHRGVNVAHLQERAGDADGEVQTRALGDFLVVHVAAVAADEAVDDVGAGRRRADDADHRVDGEADLVERGHAVFNGNLFGAIARRFEERAAMVVGGDGSLIGDFHVEDVDDEHVAGFRTFDVDGAGGGICEAVGVIQVGHRRLLVGDAVAEAIERLEQQHFARLGGGAWLVVLREHGDLVGDNLHDAHPFVGCMAS